MTADASGVIVDTSRGQKNTDQVLEEQASKQVITKHETTVKNRAQAALQLRQKMLDEAKAKMEEEEKSGSDEDDLFGDEDDDGLVDNGPMIVVADDHKDLSNDGEDLEIPDDLEIIGNKKAEDSQSESQSSDSESDQESDSDQNSASNKGHKNAIVDSLALKPVFVSKVDREMLDPSI